MKRAIGAMALLALCCSWAGCGDELVEARLCHDAADRVCEKWFVCWPVISAGIWGTQAGCFAKMEDWCTNSEYWTGCDIDNQMLRECRDGISSSPCGSLPAACNTLLDCYQENPPL